MHLLRIVFLASVLSACSGELDKTENNAPESSLLQDQAPLSQNADPEIELVLSAREQAIANAALAWIAESESSSRDFETQAQAFISSPSQASFDSVEQSLRKTYRTFQLGLLGFEILNSRIDSLDKRINAFPILPGYLDSVEGYPNSGLIHSEFELTLENLNDEHQFSDPYYLTLGFHPLKFVLHGDSSTPIAPWRRFADEGTDKSRLAAERRRVLFSLISKQLVIDIQKYKELVNASVKTQKPNLIFATSEDTLESFFIELNKPDESANEVRFNDKELDALISQAKEAMKEKAS